MQRNQGEGDRGRLRQEAKKQEGGVKTGKEKECGATRAKTERGKKERKTDWDMVDMRPSGQTFQQ